MKCVPRVVLAVLLVHGSAATQTTWSVGGQLPYFLTARSQAFDEVRRQAVVFGGCGDRFSPSVCAAGNWTLVYDGIQWTEMAPSTRPSVRTDHAMAFHRAIGRVVLFGGFDGGTILNDTWAWDGQTWTKLRPSTTPASRAQHAMAYDSARGRIVMFGGTAAPETWTFDGSNWQIESPPQSPPGHTGGHWMAYDEARDRIVMVSPSESDFVFEYDGTTWQTIPTASNHPNTQRGAGLAYDALRGRCVFLVGTITTTKTWEWDGVVWTVRSAEIPGVIFSGGMSYDRARNRVIHAGGASCTQTACNQLNATYEYSITDPAGATSFGDGCAGSGAPLNLESRPPALPWLGDDFELKLAPAAASPAVIAGLVGASRTRLGALPLPLALGALGRPDCFLFTSSEIAVPLTAVNGTAFWTVPIPSQSSLLGVSFYLQSLVVGDPTPGAVATSNGVHATVGAR